LRIKEQETRLTLHEHDGDDDYDNNDLESFSVFIISDKIFTLMCVLRGK
jgi:hypothetical protein